MFVGATLATILLLSHKIPVSFRFRLSRMKKILFTGFPAAFSMISYNLSQVITTSICLRLTSVEYLAKIYITQTIEFVSQFGYAIGQGNAILIGYLCGMNRLDEADKLQRNDAKLILCFNMALATLFALLSRWILLLVFDAEPNVLRYATAIFYLDILVEFGRGLNHAGQLGLNATGDVHYTTVVSVLGCWLLSVGLSFVLVAYTPLGLYGIWIAFALDENFRGILYLLRWKKGAWRERTKRIVSEV